MRTLLAGTLITAAVVALVVRLALPPYVEDRVEDRLEEGGGAAEVAISAIPALSLLAGRGDSFQARGTGLRFDLGDRRENPFQRLDGFKRVEMNLSELDAGPLQVERFRLSRPRREEAYDLTIRATTTPRELAGELGSAAGGPLGGLMGSLAHRQVPGRGAPGGAPPAAPPLARGRPAEPRFRSGGTQPRSRPSRNSLRSIPPV